MKMKRRIFYIGLALWLAAFIQMIDHYVLHPENENQLVSAFSSESYLTTKSALSASGSIGNHYMTTDEKQEFLLSIAHGLGISNSLVFDCQTGDGCTTASLSCSGSKTDTTFQLITTEKNISENEIFLKNVLKISINFDDSLESAFYYKNILQKILSDKNISADIRLSMYGTQSGELSMSEKNLLADTLIHNAGGKVMTEKRSDDLFTIYAYTDKVEDYLLLGSMKINLNLIISYDEQNDSTTISLSTPFYNDDF